MTNTIESTAAKIGRSMKKWEIFMRARALLLRAAGHGRRRGADLRRHLDARPARIRPSTITRSVGFEPALDDAVAVVERAERDIFLRDRVVGAHDIDELARLLAADGGIGDQQARCRAPNPAPACARTCRA